jgi:hypothetical protein
MAVTNFFAVVAVTLFLLAQPVQSATIEEAAEANPIRKVVTMLEMLKRKVQEEGEKEEALFAKYKCYCSNSGSDLQKDIDAANVKIPELQSSIEEAEAQGVQLEEDLAKHRADRTAAQQNMAEATSIREKQAATFAAYKSEADSNIAAVNAAAVAVEKGTVGFFLQSAAAGGLRKLMQSVQDNMVEADRQSLVAFLDASGRSDYAPQSGEIVGILKGLGDDMSQHRVETTADEKTAIKNYEALMAAKTREVDACTKAIEQKTVSHGENKVAVANMKNDLTDSEKTLIEDTKFLENLEKNCATNQADYDKMAETRSQELQALAETIQLLSDDDALELFKKALPSAAASFVQLKAGSESARRSRALAIVRAAQKSSTQAQQSLDFLALALHGKKVGFAKVLTMIDDMLKLLKEEQVSDDNKKEYCDKQMDSLEDKKKGLERSVSDSEKAIEDATETIATLTADIKALAAGIAALDKAVAEATELRKSENEDFTTMMSENAAAKELISLAKNRMNQFYNPKLFVPPPKRELSEQDRIMVSIGGTAPPTPAPGGVAGTGITYLAQVAGHSSLQSVTAPAPPPQAASYASKTEEGNGVVAMMDLLIADLDKQTTVGQQEEKDAQADYEQMLKDSAEKRAQDSQTLSDKGAAKADTEAALQKHEDDHLESSKELTATKQVIMALHSECDWLLQYYMVRAEARDGEIESLVKAKAVLSGADFSLIQTRTRSLRGSSF